MNMIKLEKKYIEEVTEIAYCTYLEEYKYANGVPTCSKESIRKRIEAALSNM